MSASPVDGTHAGRVAEYYSRPGLAETILDRAESALEQAGRDPSTLTYRDLAPFDQYHARGREATMELASMAGVHGGMHVLDVGGGIGGSARTLAAEFGCHVTVLDLTEDFTRAGAALTQRVGLSSLVCFRTGNALDLPFDDGSFDLAWTQHASMNIPDKEHLYAEMRRVLRPDGRLALHDFMLGRTGDVHYPVLWAPAPDLSFLRTTEEIRSLVTATGFREVAWVDTTGAAIGWYSATMEAVARSVAPGDERAARSLGARENVLRNLEEGRLACVEAVFEKVEHASVRH